MNLSWAHKWDHQYTLWCFCEWESYLSRVAWSCLAHENFPFMTLTAYSAERESVSQLNGVVSQVWGKETCRQQSEKTQISQWLSVRGAQEQWCLIVSACHLCYLKRYFFCPRSLDRVHHDSGNPGCASETRWPDEWSHTLTIRREAGQNCLYCRSTKHDEADLTAGISCAEYYAIISQTDSPSEVGHLWILQTNDDIAFELSPIISN